MERGTSSTGRANPIRSCTRLTFLLTDKSSKLFRRIPAHDSISPLPSTQVYTPIVPTSPVVLSSTLVLDVKDPWPYTARLTIYKRPRVSVGPVPHTIRLITGGCRERASTGDGLGTVDTDTIKCTVFPKTVTLIPRTLP